MHILLTVALFLMAILPSCPTRADDRGSQTTINNYTTYQQYYDKGSLALAMAASGAKAYGGTLNYQLVASGGYMDGEGAAIVGVAKKFCADCPILQANIGMVNEQTGYSISGYWVIK
jgi:hypothetical protein